METNVVKVKLWGMDVGYLSWDKKAGTAVFEFEPSFIEQGLDIAPLTMSIDSPRSRKVSDRLTPSINFQYAFLSLPAKRILWYIGH